MQPSVGAPHLDDMKIFAVLICLLTFSTDARACFILFARDGENILVANHEDWFANDTAVRIIPASSGKYASVIFTFTSEGWAQGGMNEKGLFFDAAHTPEMEITFGDDKKKPNAYIWQILLDKAATVREALAILNQYELPELAEATVMLADASGEAVLIGVHDHKTDIRPVNGASLLQTNFNQWHPELSDEPKCWRYHAAQQHLTQSSDATVANMLAILRKTHQDSMTVYSNIYDLKNKIVYTYNRRNFGSPIVIELASVFNRGDCLIALDSLVKSPEVWNCVRVENKTITIRGQVIDEKGAPLPYVNIGVPGKNAGTLSDPDGSFVITLPAALINDSIYFSHVGFEKHKIAVRNAAANSAVHLRASHTILDPITIEGKKLRSKVTRLGWMGGKDGILPLDTVMGGGAVALLIEAPDIPLYVDKLQVRLMYNSKDTITLRLHLFDYDSILDRPGEELLTEEILLQENKRFGWLRFDLAKHNIIVNKRKFFVAFEWIDDQQTRARMLSGLRAWEKWKKEQFQAGNKKVEYLPPSTDYPHPSFKYHGNMMDWPGFKDLPPFSGLMIETGKTNETNSLRTFERKTSFGEWKEIQSTLNTVITVRH